MSDAVYSKSEIVGTSRSGIEAAINNGISRARKTLRNLDWFEVTEIRGYLGGESEEDSYYQVTMKVGFRIEE
jgi:dodecin